MRTKIRFFGYAMAATAALALPAPVYAQLANASASTLGLAGNHTATARGFAAISVNPAGLAMPGSGFSLAIVPVQVRAGIDPITLTDLKDVQGQVISPTVREDWIRRIESAGGQSGSVGVDISEFALTAGNIGLQVSTVISANMTLGPRVVETMLFGNADATGQARDFVLEGSAVDGFGATTAALSFAKSLPSVTGNLAVGVTGKYTIGHGIAVATADGMATSSPIRVDVDVPMLHTDDEDYQVNNGSGFGLDVGFQLEKGPLHVGAALQNVFNSFAWDESRLVYRPGTATLELGGNDTDFDKQPLAQAPQELREQITDMKFKPALALGGAFDFPMALTVSADLRQRLGDGLAVGPKFHMGVGAEWRGLRIIHLRAGGSVVTGGVQYGGGASLVLGPINLTVGAGAITGDNADTGIVHAALSFGNR